MKTTNDARIPWLSLDEARGGIMKVTHIACSAFARAVLGAVAIAALVGPAFAQGPPPLVGVPQDWTHQHLIVSGPGAAVDMSAPGFSEAAWLKWGAIQSEPRIAIQQTKKALTEAQTAVQVPQQAVAASSKGGAKKKPPKGPPESSIHADWSMSLVNSVGTSTGSVGGGHYPAKYSFATGSANCDNAATPDFVVYNTSLPGADTTSATGAVNFPGTPTVKTDGTANAAIGGVQYSYTVTSGSVGTPGSGRCYLSSGGSSAIAASNLAGAISNGAVGNAGGSTTWVCNANVTPPNSVVSATLPSSTSVGLTAKTAGSAGNFTITLSGLGGGVTKTGPTAAIDSQATIVAYDNLYSGCSGMVPSIYWAYNTGGGTITNSPVLSLDGSKVAFVQTEGGVAHLVVLKWAKNSSATVGAATSLTSTSTCVSDTNNAPCMTSVALAGASPTVTNSSPFVDYLHDILWIGDDQGNLHKFSPVFDDDLAEVTTSPWPKAIGVSPLNSPVYDPISYNGTDFAVFVAAGNNKNQVLARVNASSGALTTSSVLGTHSNTNAIPLNPVVDALAQRVYTGLNRGGVANSFADTHAPTLQQFPVNFLSGAAPSEAILGCNPPAGGCESSTFFYAGAFDHTYLSSADSSNPSGNIYICGVDSAGTKRPALWRVPITSNAMGTPVQIAVLSTTASAQCSPLTAIYDGTTDRAFVGTSGTGALVSTCNATTGCLYSFNITTTSVTNTAGIAAPGGTSGIIIDNVNTGVTGASQVYYSPVGNATCGGNGSTGSGTHGCAVQASQAGLN
jgi:hypothetical protein